MIAIDGRHTQLGCDDAISSQCFSQLGIWRGVELGLILT